MQIHAEFGIQGNARYNPSRITDILGNMDCANFILLIYFDQVKENNYCW